jgi:hypothetical protein
MRRAGTDHVWRRPAFGYIPGQDTQPTSPSHSPSDHDLNILWKSAEQPQTLAGGTSRQSSDRKPTTYSPLGFHNRYSAILYTVENIHKN